MPAWDSGGRAALVIVHIFTQTGRTTETKQRIFAELADRLGAVGVTGADLFVGISENGPQDWSFGFGHAQYVTGEPRSARRRRMIDFGYGAQ